MVRSILWTLWILVGCFSVSAQAQETATPAPSTPFFSKGRGNGFNPETSINGLFLYRNGSDGNLASSTEPNGVGLQELELQFTADVDPYWRMLALLSLHPEVEVDAAGDRTTEFKFEPEEVFAETISVPAVTLKFGKFKAALGKHNLLHTHAFPFIDEPLLQSELLGEEGFNDVGLSAAALIPLSWYSEVTAQVLGGESEGLDYFRSRSSNDVVLLLHLKNLWDLNDAETFEFGVSGVTGQNRLESHTDFVGADVTYKWRPVSGGKETSFALSGEVLARTLVERGGARQESNGAAVWAQYQLARRWWLQARVEWLRAADRGPVTTPNSIPAHTNRASALIGFVPTEFSAFRLQYDNTRVSGTPDEEHRLMAQLNFSIGAHPAHSY